MILLRRRKIEEDLCNDRVQKLLLCRWKREGKIWNETCCIVDFEFKN